MITHIKYEYNQDQYGVIDQWDNGDLAIVSQKGDCDVSSRATIRVLRDVINELGIDYDTKNLFLFAGYYNDGKKNFGHAWMQFYLDGEWYLAEMTRDRVYTKIEKPTKQYTPYFCHNSRKGFWFNREWGVFL